jgi:hypothetical protein
MILNAAGGIADRSVKNKITRLAVVRLKPMNNVPTMPVVILDFLLDMVSIQLSRYIE